MSVHRPVGDGLRSAGATRTAAAACAPEGTGGGAIGERSGGPWLLQDHLQAGAPRPLDQKGREFSGAYPRRRRRVTTVQDPRAGVAPDLVADHFGAAGPDRL